MAAGVTYDKIATTTLGSSTQNITFSSISGSYTDLIVICRGTFDPGNLAFQVNSDTGNNYSATLLKGNGSTASSYAYSNGNSGRLGEGGNSSQNVYISHFMNYSNTTTYKTVLTRSNEPVNHTSAWVSLWRSTSAITSIKIFTTGSGNVLDSGFIATIYGVKAA